MREESAAAPLHDAEDPAAHPLYGVALLKIAMELKKDPDRAVETVVGNVVAAMGFDGRDFSRYLTRHMGLLVATAKAKGY